MRTPDFLIIGTFLLLFVLLYVFRFYQKQKKRRASYNKDILGSPGQSFYVKLDAANEALMVYFALALLGPLAIYAVHLSISYFAKVEEDRLRLIISVIAGLGIFVYSTVKVMRLRRIKRKMRLGYEGELVVGRKLDQLMHDGFHVYHGFRTDQFKIDHIVVGPKGVFAVETKALAKPATKNRVGDATVEYDGRMLYFPKDSDFEIIDQAKQKASWLSEWLGKAIGEPIAARAVVALPGWIVKRTSSEGIPVVNPKQIPSLFEHIKPRPLSASMMTRINHQIDQKCSEPDSESKKLA